MNLYRVTLTGADDSVSPSILFDIAKQYPFVEWGLLLSESRQGQARYPSEYWLRQFIQSYDSRHSQINVSLHLCGRYMRNILSGDGDVFTAHAELLEIAQRVQLNCSHHRGPVDRQRFLSHLRRQEQQWIFQLGDDSWLLEMALDSKINAVGLFDKSGGTGVLPSEWPQPTFKAESYGYAGGLGPENIEEQLPNIWTALFVSDGDGRFWVDSESKLRDSQDGFSISKCLQFLETCKPFVKEL